MYYSTLLDYAEIIRTFILCLLCAFQKSWLFSIPTFFSLHSNSADTLPFLSSQYVLWKCAWISKKQKYDKKVQSVAFLPPPSPVGNALLEDDKVFHLVRPADELDEIKSKRGSIKDKSMTKAITEIYLTRLLSVKVQRQNRLLNQTFVK